MSRIDLRGDGDRGYPAKPAGIPRGWNKIVRDSRGNVALFDFEWWRTCSNNNLFSNCWMMFSVNQHQHQPCTEAMHLPDNNKPQLRTRNYNRSLIIKTNFLNDTHLIVRMMYKYSYWMSLLWTVYITESLSELRRWQYSLSSLAMWTVLLFTVSFYLFARLVVIWCCAVLFRLRLSTF